jgi:hypothetical protein
LYVCFKKQNQNTFFKIETGTLGTANFGIDDDISVSPLAGSLFGIKGVCGVFFGPDFISVTKNEESAWLVCIQLDMRLAFSYCIAFLGLLLHP